MKVKNPHHIGQVKTFVTNNKAAISTYLQSKSAQAYVDFDTIRADNPSVKDPVTNGPLTDGTLAAIFAELGLDVVQ